MEFLIEPKFKNFAIYGNGEQFTFTQKLFSHSAEILDKESHSIASFERASWWKKQYEMQLDGQTYCLRKSLGGTEINRGEEALYRSYTGITYRSGDRVVAEVKVEGVSSRLINVRIHDREHWKVLLLAVCMDNSTVEVA